jgi:hypothetical protein
MQIHEIAQVDGNFGDTLNHWLWRDLAPGVFDDDADVRFVGIGTILDRHLPPAPLTVVLGAGTGYAPPPPTVHDARWCIYGVRGPLTARVLGLSPRAALTDPAILLALHPAFADVSDDGGVVFVPHWKSVRYGQWREACALAGIEFIDPCEDAHRVIRRIAGARKVIAESMHAAIVADAFRVPWVPVLLSREVAPFKWADWAATLDLTYEPVQLAPSSSAERWRERVLRHSAYAYVGRRAADGDVLRWNEDELLRDHARAIGRISSPVQRHASTAAEILLKRAARWSAPLQAQLSPHAVARQREAAALQLVEVARREGWLSSPAAHQRALTRCGDALQMLVRDHRLGRLRPRTAAAPLTSVSGSMP